MPASLATLRRRLERLVTSRAGVAVASKLACYVGRPVEYARDHLGRALTPQQVEILRKLDEPPYRVLARSANNQGKTFVAAVKCSHFYDTVKPSITLATAPTAVQVRDLLFKELRTLRPSSAGFLPKDTRLQSGWDHFVHGFTAAKADAFQGRHGTSLGLLFDEATGIDPEFWGRGETMFQPHPGYWWLCTYNPNDSASRAYLEEERGGWHVVVLNALEHPNILAEIQGQPPPIPAAIRLDSVIGRMSRECEEVKGVVDPAEHFEFPVGSGNWWRPLTPDFEAQILGRWPVSPTTALFSPVAAERLFTNAIPVNPAWKVVVGCDVARFGDDKTTIAVRCGPCLLRLEAHSKLSTTAIADRLRFVVRETLNQLGLDNTLAKTIIVYVDDTGGYGAGVIDQSHGYAFHGVNASTTALDPRYPNTRTQLWMTLAALSDGGALDFSRLSAVDRQSLKTELTSCRYTLNARGQRVIEPKSMIKERLKRSPDRADAVALAFYLAEQG